MGELCVDNDKYNEISKRVILMNICVFAVDIANTAQFAMHRII